jgi:hypothetical protein
MPRVLDIKKVIIDLEDNSVILRKADGALVKIEGIENFHLTETTNSDGRNSPPPMTRWTQYQIGFTSDRRTV